MDLFVLFVFFLMIGVGIYRGFTMEILGLFSLICAISLAVISNKWIVTNLLGSIDNQFIASIGTYIITFIFFILVLNFIIKYIAKILRNEENSILDRFFGGALGFIKGYIFCLFVYFLVYSFSSVLNPDFENDNKIENVQEITPYWLKDSKSYPIFYNSIVKLDYLIKKLNKEKYDNSKKDEKTNKEKIEIDIKNNKNENLINLNQDESENKKNNEENK